MIHIMFNYKYIYILLELLVIEFKGWRKQPEKYSATKFSNNPNSRTRKILTFGL